MSKTFREQDRCAVCGYMRWHGDDCPRCADRLTRRPATSNADEWQLYLQDGLQGEPETGCAFLAVQIVEAIEEHQRALATEVYRLAENTAMRFSDLAAEDTPSGHFYRGSISEAKSIARAINAIMPLSRFARSTSSAERGMREALEPFAKAFVAAREKYAKRYEDAELGRAKFDAMPDSWPMEKLTFDMGAFRKALNAALSPKGEGSPTTTKDTTNA